MKKNESIYQPSIARRTPKIKIVFALVSLYAFLVCFGNYFRFGTAESATGISTYIFVIILLLSPAAIIRGFSQERFLQLTLILIFISMISAFFYPGDIQSPLIGSISLLAYLFLASAVAGSRTDSGLIYGVIVSISLGLLVASVITILDLVGIYDFENVNETDIVSRMGGAEAAQVAGFFSRRSGMAAFYSLYIPVVLITAFERPRASFRSIHFVSAGLAFVCLFLTHNRSGTLGIIISVSLYLLFSKGMKFSRRIRTVILFVVLSITVGILASIYFPEHLGVYSEKLGGYFSENKGLDREVSTSDYSRIYFFQQAMLSIGDSPIGHGFAYMYTERYGFMDTHNIISHIIWSTGIFGIIWLVFSLFVLRRDFFFSIPNDEFSPYVVALKFGLIAWLLNNMTHNNINMGMIWVMIGLQFSMRASYRARVGKRRREKEGGVR